MKITFANPCTRSWMENPPTIWMYVWLGIGIVITLINIYNAIKGSTKWIKEKNSNKN